MMSTMPLPKLLEHNIELLDSLLTDGCRTTQDAELAGLIHAAWMRLKNWESDIKNEERSTLSRITQLSPPTAAIVEARLIRLKQATERVKDANLTAETIPEDLRYVVIQKNT
jgi:hypothetical protein